MGGPADPETVPATGSGVLTSAGLTARAGEQSWGPNPLKAGDTAYTVTISSTDSGEERARLVSAEPLLPLRLEPAALVVREGEHIVRYTLAADDA